MRHPVDKAKLSGSLSSAECSSGTSSSRDESGAGTVCDKNSPLKRRSFFCCCLFLSFFLFFSCAICPQFQRKCAQLPFYFYLSPVSCSLHTVCYLSIQRIKDAQIIILDVHETWVCGSLFLPTNGYHFSCLNKA